jgi:oligoribonuclease (3'-5' exoribonuclease)
MIHYYGLDFETSGTDPWGDAVPIELGISTGDKDIEYRIGGWDWNQFTWSPESEAIHGITQKDLESELPAWTVDILAAADIVKLGGSRMFTVIVGWNVAGFDRQFITRWMPNLNRCLSYRTVDLNALVFGLAGDDEGEYVRIRKASKSYAADQLHYENWHSALYDAKAALYSFDYLRKAGS